MGTDPPTAGVCASPPVQSLYLCTFRKAVGKKRVKKKQITILQCRVSAFETLQLFVLESRRSTAATQVLGALERPWPNIRG
jgi:hypothetical protein